MTTTTLVNGLCNIGQQIGFDNLKKAATDLYNKEYKSSFKNFSEGFLRIFATFAITEIAYRSLHANSISEGIKRTFASGIPNHFRKVERLCFELSLDWSNSFEVQKACNSNIIENPKLSKMIADLGFSSINSIKRSLEFFCRATSPDNFTSNKEYSESFLQCINNITNYENWSSSSEKLAALFPDYSF